MIVVFGQCWGAVRAPYVLILVCFRWVRTRDRPFPWLKLKFILSTAGSSCTVKDWACLPPPDAASVPNRGAAAAVLWFTPVNSPSLPLTAYSPLLFATVLQSKIGSGHPAPPVSSPLPALPPCIRLEWCFLLWAAGVLIQYFIRCCSMIAAIVRSPSLFPWKFMRGWRFPDPWLHWWSWGRRSLSWVVRCQTAPSPTTLPCSLFPKAVAASLRWLSGDPRWVSLTAASTIQCSRALFWEQHQHCSFPAQAKRYILRLRPAWRVVPHCFPFLFVGGWFFHWDL